MSSDLPMPKHSIDGPLRLAESERSPDDFSGSDSAYKNQDSTCEILNFRLYLLVLLDFRVEYEHVASKKRNEEACTAEIHRAI